MTEQELQNIVEAAILASGKPVTVDKILGLFEKDEQPERDAIKAAIETLQSACAERGVELVHVASGYRYQVRQTLSQWINRLIDERPPRYSRALLETLALVAYRQPITRAEIEDVRGVSVSTSIIRTLLEREWVRVVGHRDVPGRPALYATTRHFLDYFDLKTLSELPALSELRDIDAIEQDLFAGLEAEGFIQPTEEDAANADDRTLVIDGSAEGEAVDGLDAVDAGDGIAAPAVAAVDDGVTEPAEVLPVPLQETETS